jgi:hypothetical protein
VNRGIAAMPRCAVPASRSGRSIEAGISAVAQVKDSREFARMAAHGTTAKALSRHRPACFNRPLDINLMDLKDRFRA